MFSRNSDNSVNSFSSRFLKSDHFPRRRILPSGYELLGETNRDGRPQLGRGVGVAGNFVERRTGVSVEGEREWTLSRRSIKCALPDPRRVAAGADRESLHE